MACVFQRAFQSDTYDGPQEKTPRKARWGKWQIINYCPSKPFRTNCLHSDKNPYSIKSAPGLLNAHKKIMENPPDPRRTVA
jgi:hypothetical protein